MFRKEALQQMQSPDDLNQLLVVVTPRSWILMMTIAGLCGVALLWSIFGRIPISVDGFGVLISPGNVKGLQSDVSGQITRLLIRVGQQVNKGDVIAELSQPELQQQLAQSREKLPELERFHKLTEDLDRERLELEALAVEEQARFITEEIARAGQLADQTNEAAISFTDKQRENLGRTRELMTELNKSLKGRVQTISGLRREGLSSDDSVLSARSSAMESELKVASLEVQAQELEMQEIRRQETELQSRNRLADLKLQLLQLPIKKKQMEQQIAQARRSRELEITDLRDRIKALEFRLEDQSKIESTYTGRVLELSASAGQLVGQGMRLATVEVDNPDDELMNLAYFKIKDGKRIQPGSRIMVTPSNVERERYGSIIGKVEEVAPFPITRQGAVNEIGSEEIVESLMSSGGAIEIKARLETDPQSVSGYKWTSKGPDMKFSAGTTTTVRVIVEQRAPITYVIPMLRTWLFAEKDDHIPTF